MHTGPRIARLPLLLAFAFVSTWAFSQAVQPPPQSLLPVPREYASRSTLSLAHGVRVENAHALSTDDRFAIDNLLATLKDDGVHQSVAQNAIQLSVLSPETVTGRRILKRYDQEFTPAMHDEGYVLIAEGHSIDLIAATSSGIFYATQTLKQLVSNDAIQGSRIYRRPLPGASADACVPGKADPHHGGLQGQRLLTLFRDHACLSIKPAPGALRGHHEPRRR
jgi:hypothetical protein